MFCWIAQCGPTAKQPLDSDCFSGDIICQNGPEECQGNLIEGCVVKYYTSNVYASFLDCAEGDHSGSVAAMPGCAATANIDWNLISSCINNVTEANEVHLTYAQKTIALGAAKQGTPWILVNGVVLKDPDDLFLAVCEAYQGVKPLPCGMAYHEHLLTKKIE
eukprot:c8115_g1_i7.p1 GENE.c8115_g1_i7~~c8115_g1_i7.p1  ORF type:complete len:162 (+),score=28.48 c8115_g1_i7:402-887(+)